MKPVIGILGALGIVQTPGAAVKSAHANDAYCQAVIRAGGVPAILPVTDKEDVSNVMFSLCDGFLFPGGEDVDPRFYREAPHPLLGTVNQTTDRFWIDALNYAGENHLPVMGICRGMQLVNVALGGSLYQDMSERDQMSYLHAQHQGRDYLMHQVTIKGGSRLLDILGCEELYTNTMHHQCVKGIGVGLKISALTGDGVVEAMETEDGSILLVQWHPEELQESDSRMEQLFNDLIKRAMHKEKN